MVRSPWSGLPAIDRAAREIGLHLTDHHRTQVLREQMRMVLLHTRIGTLAATAFALVLAVHLHGRLDAGASQTLLLGWVVVKVVVAATRMAFASAWVRQPDGAIDAPRWRHAMLGLLALDGLVWGIGGWALMDQSVPLVALVVAALDGVSCVATFGLQVRLAATAAYVLPILIPLTVGLALRPDELAHIGAVGQLLLTMLLMATALAASRRLAAGLLLRLQAVELVAEKEAALRLAHEQSAERQRFLAKVSHELRTPLHGMLGLTRLLHQEAREPLLLHRLGLIENSGTQLLALIDDLLEVSLIQADRFALKVGRFDLAALLDEVSELFSLRAAEKGLRFELRSSLPRPCPVQGDAARLRQVLNNLLGNAVKFTAEGCISLHARPAAQPERVAFAVVDTGPGIGAGDFSRIFQPFEQLAAGAAGGPAPRRPLSGTDGVGLGLTIAREIAQAMGSDITVHSLPGRGATFAFEARLPTLPPLPGEAGADVAAPRLPVRVLVAEDDALNVLIVGAYLDSLGVGYEHAADGRQAVNAALRNSNRPDLVLMDCRMPVMDGLEATREIRREEARRGWSRLPVLALTATATAADRQACLDVGMDEVITKPFTRQQLSDALQQARRASPPA